MVKQCQCVDVMAMSTRSRQVLNSHVKKYQNLEKRIYVLLENLTEPRPSQRDALMLSLVIYSKYSIGRE